MPVFRTSARNKADRIAAVVGLLAFVAGIAAVTWGAMNVEAVPTVRTTTVVTSPIQGEPVTTTTQSTAPPVSATKPPVVTQDVTVTEGAGNGSSTTTTQPAAIAAPWLGSRTADITFQVLLVTLAALLLAWGTRSVLLGSYGAREIVASGSLPIVDVEDAAAVKRTVGEAAEAPDLSRPLYEKAPVTDPRMRLLQSRIALELEVRTLAQHNDLPSGLTVPYVVKGLVERKKMTPKLAAAVTQLNSIGDKLSRGADISLDTTTLLTDAYAQALAKVGGKIK